MAEKTSKKNRTLTIRLTDYEKNTVVAKANRCNMSVTNFVITTLITNVTAADNYLSVMKCLKKLTDKLIIISEALNDTNVFSDDFHDVLDLQKELKNEMVKIISLA